MKQIFIILCILKLSLTIPVYEKDYDEGVVSVPKVGGLNFGDRISTSTTTTTTTSATTTTTSSHSDIETSTTSPDTKGIFPFADIIDHQNIVQISSIPLFSAFNVPWLSQISFHESILEEQEALNETQIQVSGFDDDFINSTNSNEDDIENNLNVNNSTIKQRDVTNSIPLNKTKLSHSSSSSSSDNESLTTKTTRTTTEKSKENNNEKNKNKDDLSEEKNESSEEKEKEKKKTSDQHQKMIKTKIDEIAADPVILTQGF